MKLLDSGREKVIYVQRWVWSKSLKVKLLLLVLLLVLGWLLSRPLFNASKQPQYQTAQVERGTLVTSVTASGNIASGNAVSITTTATGVVSQVYVVSGDTVAQGDKIADITLDQSSQQRQTAAWASYLSAKSSLDAAAAKMNSLQSALFKANQAFVNDKGISNPSDAQKADPKYIMENADWLQAEADYKNQAVVISAAQAAASSAWLSYQQISSTITAPSEGVVTNLTLTPGLAITSSSNNSSSSTSNTSNNSSTQTLGTITLESGTLQAKVNLSEIDVTSVKPGQKVTITLDAFPDKTFTGHVASIDTTGVVSSGVTTYPATVTIDTNVNNIYPNMAVSAKIITAVKDSVLLVPNTAVQTLNGASTVRVMRNGRVEPVEVEVGAADDTATEIVSGISEGDIIVTSTITQGGSTRTTSSPFGGFGGRGGAGGGAVFFRRQ